MLGFEAGDLNELGANAGRIERACRVLGRLDVVLIAHGLLGDQVRSEDRARSRPRTRHNELHESISLLIPIANYLEQQGHGTSV